MYKEKEFAAKQDTLKSSNPSIKFLSYSEAMKDLEFIHSGESRGVAFQIEEHEVLYFPPLDQCVIFWTTFLDRREKTEHKVFKTLAYSSKRGWVEFPLSRLCYVPGQEYEQKLLWTDENCLGKYLAMAGSDPARLGMVAGKYVEAYHVFDGDHTLHQNYWRRNKDTGQREFIEDADGLDYRKPLRAVQFKEVTKK